MREIKFRGLSAKGKWVFGLIVKDVPHSTQYWDDYPCRISWHPEAGGQSNCPVRKGTEGQYTGLEDSNGVEIYEGDIVEFIYWWFDGNEAESLLIGTIVYSDNSMSFQLKGVKNKAWEKHTGYENDTEYLTPFSELNFDEADFKVIGNIHETPELLITKGE